MNNKRRYTGDTLTVAADTETEIFVNQADYFIVFSADEQFQIALDDEPFSDFSAGRSVNPPDEFKKVRIKNLSGSTLTMEYAFGVGGVDDNALQVLGIVSVKNESGGSLETNNPDLETLLQNDEDLRQGLTTLENASWAQVNNATTTVVSAVANTNGIIIRTGCVNVNAAAFAEIRVGSNDIVSVFATSGAGNCLYISNIFIPAGNSLVIHSSSGSATSMVYYEVL